MTTAVGTGGMGVTQMLMAAVGGIAGGALVAWGLLETGRPIVTEPQRDARQIELFLKRSACPVNGKRQEACPGWVIGYLKPLCAGGVDRAANMQWQTVATAKKKEREAQKVCVKGKRA